MLMPSFCWPLVVGPKPAITRPLAGQRNFGSAPVPSADLTASLAADASATGVNTLALTAGSGSLGAGAGAGTEEAAAGAAAVLAGAAAGEALGFAVDTRTPGMTNRSP